MLAPKITNHVQAALARFIQQYKNIPAQYTLPLNYTGGSIAVSALFAILAALVDQIQDLENVIFSLDAGRQLFNGTSSPAIGAQLDGLGEIIGIRRNGLDDVEYLVFLIGTIAENNSDTTISSVENIVALLFQVDTLFAAEFFPASIGFQIPDSSPLPASVYQNAISIIINSLGAGIGLAFLSLFPAASPFLLQFITPALVTTGDTSSGSNQLSALASTAGITVGATISGAGIPETPFTTVVTLVGSTVTMSANAVANQTTVGVAFGPRIGGGCSDLNNLAAVPGGGLASNIYNNPGA